MSPAWLRRRGVRMLLATLSAGCMVAMTLATGQDAQSMPSWVSRRDVDVTASANSGPAAEHPVDTAFRVTRVAYRRIKGDATAQASALCEGCTADARALHIVFLDWGSGGIVNNVAAAWSRCSGCRSSALSVQVVVVRGRLGIEAHNRALAVNADCEGCVAASAAFQIVVVGDERPQLSRADRRELRRWTVEQSAALRQGAGLDGVAARSARSIGSGAHQLSELSRLVNGALGTTTLRRNVQLRLP